VESVVISGVMVVPLNNMAAYGKVQRNNLFDICKF